ncbi:MAG TPA: hypothetical protein EYH30_04880 [Anaerolineales bacterium]|nr:hypothetical protein [Anaerolineae bacterium]HIQ01449.1 hypothetical protein [Anaerolineales bacterium]
MNDLLNFYNAHKMKISFTTGAILGLFLGLLVAWVIWPTSYYNATPPMLRQDFRDDYLAWVAREYVASEDVEQARARLGLEFWKESPSETLEDLAHRRGGEDAANLQTLAQALGEPAPATEPATTPEPEETSLLQRARPVLQVCGAGLVAATLAGLLYLGVSRLRRREPRPVSKRAPLSHVVVEKPTAWGEMAPPIAQFKTTYTLGDDFYDPSFSIEKETSDFMGECGVGISEAIGVGDPKKVTALEVWLFDKNDIRTITKVLMSDFAFQDEALRAKLAAKGEPVLARPGTTLTLETATLVLQARVEDMEYGQGQLPPSSFFQRITLDLGVWIKPEGEAPAAPDFATPPTI